MTEFLLDINTTFAHFQLAANKRRPGRTDSPGHIQGFRRAAALAAAAAARWGRRVGNFRSVAHLITVTAMEEGLSVHPIHGRPIGLKARPLLTFPHRTRNYRLRMPANPPPEYLAPTA